MNGMRAKTGKQMLNAKRQRGEESQRAEPKSAGHKYTSNTECVKLCISRNLHKSRPKTTLSEIILTERADA